MSGCALAVGVLEDPHQAIPPYDALLLVSPQRTRDAAFGAALHPLIGAVSVQAMRKANELVDGRGASPQQAARELGEIIGLRNSSRQLRAAPAADFINGNRNRNEK